MVKVKKVRVDSEKCQGHNRCYAMGREHDHRPLRDLVYVLYEDNPSLFKGTYDPLVVDNGVSHVDGRTMDPQRKVDDFDSVRDACAKPSGGS